MRGTRAPSPQLALPSADDHEVRWHEVPTDLRSEVRAVLRTLLQRGATDAGRAEVGDDHQ